MVAHLLLSLGRGKWDHLHRCRCLMPVFSSLCLPFSIDTHKPNTSLLCFSGPVTHRYPNMPWQAIQYFQPQLPAHCSPETEFLTTFSSTFHTCVPTKLAFVSTTLGCLSILSWLFAQLPQIYKNYTLKSTSGLSIFFLVEWCLGDLTNLLGAIFTHQATWQMIVAGYYCFVDFMLVAQWLWYEKLKHGYTIRRVWPRRSDDNDSTRGGVMQQVVIDGMPALSRETSTAEGEDTSVGNNGCKSQAKDIGDSQRGKWRMPNFLQTDEDDDEKTVNSPSQATRTIYRAQASGSLPSPSPRTVIMLACLISLATASPVKTTLAPSQSAQDGPTPLEATGTVLSWLSTALYLGSRLPQIYKNWSRQSTAGLSPGLFAAAFFGNLFYSSSMMTNPNAWYSSGAYGGGGWAGKEGNSRVDWVLTALPFWLGAAGVLGLDGAVGVQFVLYGDGGEAAKVVVLEEEPGHGHWRWRRVSGWMRGWVPNFSEPSRKIDGGEEERAGLLDNDRPGSGSGYGTHEAGAA